MMTRAAEAPEYLEAIERPLREGDRKFQRIELDPWGQDYRVEREGRRLFRIWSNGPDGEPGTADDICYEPLDDIR